MWRRTGFTLVELLVVIAILSLLAAILFPVFAQARATARKASCLSSLRQIGMAALMYVHDHDETLLSPALRRPAALPSTSTSRYFWGRAWTVWPELILPYNNHLDLYSCPERPDNPYWGYSINVNSSNDTYPGSPTPPGNWNEGTAGGGMKPGQYSPAYAEVTSPATTIWFYDSNPSVFHAGVTDWAQLEALARRFRSYATTLEMDGSRQMAQILRDAGGRAEKSSVIRDPWRHGQFMTVGWCDGHVSSVRPSRIREEWWSIEQIPQPRE